MSGLLHACTIVSKNYLPFARVLAESFLAHHPGGTFHVLLLDRVDGHFDPAAERFTTIEVEELAARVPDLPSFLFKYSVLEANTAIKPFFLAHLFATLDLPHLVYLDPDILVYRPLDELAAALAEHDIVLTPHLLAPIDDDRHPGELAVLQSGAYNLGFLALARTERVDRLLAWWSDRLEDRCVVRIEDGLFVDQKWMDLVPGLFPGAHVLTAPGYNVAYWNLAARTVEGGPHDPRANGEPLWFFHFSGIEPEALDNVSKHQDRFRLGEIGGAADLYRDYRDRLLAAGYRELRRWPYAFGRFDDGTRIPDLARHLYHGLGPSRRRFGDPFATAGRGSFFAWLQSPRGAARQRPYLTQLVGHLWDLRPDLQRSFPEPEGRDLAGVRDWMRGAGLSELGLDPVFLEPLLPPPEEPGGLAPSPAEIRGSLRRLWHSGPMRWLKTAARRRLGPQKILAIKRRLGLVQPTAGEDVAGPRLPRRPSLERLGVNLVGYLQAETGMGEAARGLARALEAAGIEVSLHSLDLNVWARRGDDSFEAAVSDFPFDVNLFVVNADQTLAVYEHLGHDVFAGRWNVGYWLWELERFPAAWQGAFDVLHEVWTPSTFCLDAISERSPVPVRRVPLPLPPEVDAPPAHGRTHFGLPEDRFLVLFVFNFLSHFERKNPLAAVAAFREAFADRPEALLVLKTSQSDFAPEKHRELVAAAGEAGVRVIDGYLSRQEMASLIACCDVYLSLHRSEGWGLTIAEAMARGIPVVATPYSGNVDFFGVGTGLPVAYGLELLAADSGPYPAGSRWASPDVADAAAKLRWALDEPQQAKALAERGRQRVREDLSVEAVGAVLRRRFDEIVRQAARGRFAGRGVR